MKKHRLRTEPKEVLFPRDYAFMLAGRGRPSRSNIHNWLLYACAPSKPRYSLPLPVTRSSYMTFLTQLAAEWYGYNGYFVKTGVRFGKKRGDARGEVAIAAYNAEKQEFAHIETSADKQSWEWRKRDFVKKFSLARYFYDAIFPFPKKAVRRIALVGSAEPSARVVFGEDVEVLYIPEFIRTVLEKLKSLDPLRGAVPECYPLLRAMQYAAFYGRRRYAKQRLKL